MKTLLHRLRVVWNWLSGLAVVLLVILLITMWPDRKMYFFQLSQRMGWSVTKSQPSVVQSSDDDKQERLIPPEVQIDDKKEFDLVKSADLKSLLSLVLKLVFQSSHDQPNSMRIAWRVDEMHLDEIELYLIRDWGTDGAPSGRPTNTRLRLRGLPGEVKQAPSLPLAAR